MSGKKLETRQSPVIYLVNYFLHFVLTLTFIAFEMCIKAAMIFILDINHSKLQLHSWLCFIGYVDGISTSSSSSNVRYFDKNCNVHDSKC